MEAQTYAPFKKVYLFDPVTGIYTGTGNARLSPLDVPGTYLYHTHSTDTAPPTAAVNQVAVFDRGGWSLKPDYRWQTIYNQTDGSDKLVTAIGSLPDGYALTPPPPTPPTTQELIALLEIAVQQHLDSTAQSKGYDSAHACISYINSSNATWQSEAHAMNVWRDAVWGFCQTLETSGTAESLPTKEQLIGALPIAPW